MRGDLRDRQTYLSAPGIYSNSGPGISVLWFSELSDTMFPTHEHLEVI